MSRLRGRQRTREPTPFAAPIGLTTRQTAPAPRATPPTSPALVPRNELHHLLARRPPVRSTLASGSLLGSR
eukprot:3701414-Prymnesium_polylepis.1